jgi:hypothetical protein
VFEGTNIPPGSQGIQANVGRIDFGSAAVGKTATKTFTVKNVGTTNIVLSNFIGLPEGFTLMKRLGTTQLAPGRSTTFVMALNSSKAGRLAGQLVLRSGAGQADLFRFAVTGTALAPPSMRIVTRADTGFHTIGNWSPLPAANTGVGALFAQPGKGQNQATWTISGLQPGRYVVSATWPSNPNAAADAQFTVLNGTRPFRAVTVNQRQAPADFVDAGTSWKTIGEPYLITDGTLVVRLSDQAGAPVLADAVRVERVNFAGRIIDNSDSGFSTTGPWTRTRGVGFQGDVSRAAGDQATATWTFTGLRPGQYRVSATWPAGFREAADATYTILDGTRVLARIQLNQQQARQDLSDAGTRWQDLGELGTLYPITGNTLVVRLSGIGHSRPIADALRVEHGSGPGGASSDADIVRFLEQCTFGPTDQLVAHVRDDLGGDFGQFLIEQGFYTDPSGYPSMPLFTDNIDDPAYPDRSCVNYLPSGSVLHNQCQREHYQMFSLQRQFFLNALYASDQSRQRMAWALHKILVVSGLDGTINRAYRFTPYLQVFEQNAFGNYYDVLRGITLNYDMGVYLNMATSTRTNPNENYAREILQLFSIGLTVLNPDGTPVLDNQGLPIPTYNQDTITNFARLFTGWQRAPNRPEFPNALNYLDPMVPGPPGNHDTTSKTLLRGFVTTAGHTALQDLNDGLDNIYNDPNVAPFISRQLIQQLVTSNPSPGYIARVSSVFDIYRGDPNQLWWVLYYIVLDPEARGDVITDPTYGKLREPALFAANLLRAFPAVSYNDPGDTSDGVLNVNVGSWSFILMDQDVLRPPTVFSYFLPDNAVQGTGGLFGPEFQILSTVTAMKRMNLLNGLVNPNGAAATYGIAPTNPATDTSRPKGTKPDLTQLVALATADPTGGQVADYLNYLMLHGTMSDQMRADLLTAVTVVPASNPLRRAKTALYLLGNSSQYQVQR